jgi:hypothetical protein
LKKDSKVSPHELNRAKGGEKWIREWKKGNKRREKE